MIEADTPNLWEIRRNTDHATVAGILVIALTHAARLINLEANLNKVQIAEIVNDIIKDFGYMKVEEIKHVLKTAVRTKKIFGRLDYNIVMGWFEEYAIERTAHCVDISQQEETQAANQITESPEAISFEEYLKQLRERVAAGDDKAKDILDGIENPPTPRMELISPEEQHQKDVAFFKFKQEYLKNGKQRTRE